MEKLEDKLTYQNYKEFSKEIAEKYYPKGSLVNWSEGGGSISFGIVKSISNKGKITVQAGKLPLKDVTDNEGTGGTYGKFWYEANIDKFKPLTKEETEFHYKTPTRRFNPKYFDPDQIEEGLCPIDFTQISGNRELYLGKPEINKDGLIMEESYSP